MEDKLSIYERIKEDIFRDTRICRHRKTKDNYYYHLGKMDALYVCGLITKEEREELFSLVEINFREEK